jgi:hypothetical protein
MKILNLSVISSERPRWEKTPDGFLRCPARLLAERVMPYLRSEVEEQGEGTINLFVRGDSISTPEALRSLEGAPLVAGDHIWMTPETARGRAVGAIAGSPRWEPPYLVADLLVTDPEAIQKIEAGELPEISAGYTAEVLSQPGEFNGSPYDAEQTQLRFNHIAIIPAGHGRAGADVRILNQKKEAIMPVRIQLKNTKTFINVEEEAANAIAAEETASAASLEETMGQLEEKSGQMAALQEEVDTLKGELSVYKEKLDELLSTEALEHAAMGMVAEQTEAADMIENSTVLNEKGEEMAEEEKKEFANSIRSLWGEQLQVRVLNSLGVKTEGMSSEEVRGAYKANLQICNAMKGKRKPEKKEVAGAKLFQNASTTTTVSEPGAQRSPLARLGFPVQK